MQNEGFNYVRRYLIEVGMKSNDSNYADKVSCRAVINLLFQYNHDLINNASVKYINILIRY